MNQFLFSQSKIQAVIVEPREHEGLLPVLENMCSKLPEVPITIVHGTQNGEYVKEKAEQCPCVHKIYEANADNFNAATYSKLMTSNAFWDAMGDREKTLVFQTDSGICGEGELVSQFVEFDYCGAPWNWAVGQDRPLVGNGGFSLRNTEIFREHVRNDPEHTINEDVKFVEWCTNDPNCNLCPDDVGKKFAVETMNDTDSWAFHNNISYTGKSICDLNQTIHDLNKKSKGMGNPPDAETYEPSVRFVSEKNMQ